MASLLTGGTMKQTEGTAASRPEWLRTFHLKGWELLRSAHSSPLWTVIWRTIHILKNTHMKEAVLRFCNKNHHSGLLTITQWYGMVNKSVEPPVAWSHKQLELAVCLWWVWSGCVVSAGWWTLLVCSGWSPGSWIHSAALFPPGYYWISKYK